MSTEPPPLPPSSRSDWFGRHWVAVTLVGVAAGGVLIALFVFGVVKMLRESEPYAEAMRRVSRSPAVVEALGTPIEAEYWFTGNISFNNRNGRAEFDIPIHGPGGRAAIYLKATKLAGKWHYDLLAVTIERSQKRVFLSDPARRPADSVGQRL